MKKLMTIATLALVLLIVTGCQPQGQTPNANASNPPVQTQAAPMMLPLAVPTVQGLPEGYDPSSEEDYDILLGDTGDDGDDLQIFAGATPIPLNPVDMPTPTPRQDIVFTYATYTATNLGLTFESVAGYTVDDSQPDTYILNEPADRVKDNYPVQFLLSLSPVGANYTRNSIRTDVRNYATDLGKVNYKEWRLYDTAERTLMGKPGYYVNFRGVMHDGTIVRGRVHMALLDNQRLLTLSFTCPAEYNSDYTGVYTHMRSTLKAI